MSSRSRFPLLLVGVVVLCLTTACTASSSSEPSEPSPATVGPAPSSPPATTPVPSSSSTPVATPTPTASPPPADPATASDQGSSDEASSDRVSPLDPSLDPVTTPGPAPNGFELVVPDDPVGAPTVVLVHGGAWVAGSPDSLQDLAEGLADRGAIVVNLGYSTLMMGGGHPRTFDELACGFRQARAIGEQLGGSGELVVVGHSAGAHLALVVALDDQSWGQDCPFGGSAQPDRFVGLAGFYDIDAVAPLMQAFLGGSRSELPAVWDAVDPAVLVAEGAPGVGAFPVRFHVGDEDTVAPISISQGLSDAMVAAGVDATTDAIPLADHFTIMTPDVSADLVLQE